MNQHTPFPFIAGHRPYTPFLEKNKCIQKNKNSHFSKYYKNALYIFFKAAHVHSLFSLTKQPSIRASERYRERERERSLFIRILGFPYLTTDAQFRNSNLRIWYSSFFSLSQFFAIRSYVWLI